ncbi:MAG: alpha/beta fold hydrolase [Chitinophagaceae bacterium]|nr:alpha/beta fold hydrolase [Chitinophagaceae bacterium]
MRYILSTVATILFFSSNLFAQSKFIGDWKGVIKAGQELKVYFHINRESNDELTATLDVPMQGATGVECTGVEVIKDSITIEIKAANLTYKGRLKDKDNIDGQWVQNGMSMAVPLERTEEKVVLKRPQTPKAPFGYNSEDVIYYNADKSIRYGATITSPKDDNQHPAIILISGSGQQNRDEEAFGHKPFAVMADYLSNNGYVVLRVDDQGVGKTTGNPDTATSADYARDVMVGIEFLKTRKEVDKKKIGLMGHSEGGMIAPMVATQSKDVNFIRLLAGPGVHVNQLMTEQNIAILQKAGWKEEYINSYAELYRQILAAITHSETIDDYIKNANEVVDDWKAKTDEQTVKMTTNITGEASQNKFIETFAEIYKSNWYRYFVSYDPQPTLEALKCKVLALNGEKDIQVLPESNLKGIDEALKKSKVKVYETKMIPGVNHLFQECEKCTVQEYVQLEQTIKPEVLQIIGEWLDKNVK